MRATLLIVGTTALLLAGCSTAPPTPAPDTAPPETDDGAFTLCDVATAAQMEELFSQPVGEGEVKTHTVDSDTGFQIVSPECRWVIDDVIDIKLVYTQGTAFESRALECEELDSLAAEVIPVDGIGERAWWAFDDVFDAEGELRVCTTDAQIDVRIEEKEGDSVTQQGQAVALVELVLAAER